MKVYNYGNDYEFQRNLKSKENIKNTENVSNQIQGFGKNNMGKEVDPETREKPKENKEKKKDRS